MRIAGRILHKVITIFVNLLATNNSTYKGKGGRDMSTSSKQELKSTFQLFNYCATVWACKSSSVATIKFIYKK